MEIEQSPIRTTQQTSSSTVERPTKIRRIEGTASSISSMTPNEFQQQISSQHSSQSPQEEIQSRFNAVKRLIQIGDKRSLEIANTYCVVDQKLLQEHGTSEQNAFFYLYFATTTPTTLNKYEEKQKLCDKGLTFIINGQLRQSIRWQLYHCKTLVALNCGKPKDALEMIDHYLINEKGIDDFKGAMHLEKSKALVQLGMNDKALTSCEDGLSLKNTSEDVKIDLLIQKTYLSFNADKIPDALSCLSLIDPKKIKNFHQLALITDSLLQWSTHPTFGSQISPFSHSFYQIFKNGKYKDFNLHPRTQAHIINILILKNQFEDACNIAKDTLSKTIEDPLLVKKLTELCARAHEPEHPSEANVLLSRLVVHSELSESEREMFLERIKQNAQRMRILPTT